MAAEVGERVGAMAEGGGDVKAFVGFAGFGGFSLALREAGFETVEVEIEPRISRVNRHNGGYVIIADLLDIDLRDYVGYVLMQFSPPCPNFSIANANRGGETEADLRLARKICQFISVGRPKYFVLENVSQYRRSLSWLQIWYTLLECGYGVDAWTINTADYGVPQSRRRMIAIARRDGHQPAKPWPTHSKNGDLFTKPWVGWFEAIEDLIPTLIRGQFAPWQRRGMPEKYNSFLLGNGSRSRPKSTGLPTDTITANCNQLSLKAFIVDGANGRGDGRHGPTIRRRADQPMFTVTASPLEKNSPPKAFIVGGQFQTPSNGQPRTVQNRDAPEPIWTIMANDHMDTRAYIAEEGYTVVMDVRCLARFQGFPDWFQFPSDRRLACRGIGNAVPPSLAAAIIRSLEI